MPTLDAPDYTIARFVIERGLALIYAIAFLVAANQFPALSGERGLQPATRLLARTRFLEVPSLFHWGYSDRRLRLVAWAGIAISILLVIGLPQRAPLPVTMAAWLALWILYQSIVNVGGTFYGFGWESLLLEAGFLAIFLGNAETAPQWLVILAFRWLAFRVEFGAGLIKLRGDECWRRLRCMDFHHETQPMPNPLSWFFHHLPRPLHRLEVARQLLRPAGPAVRPVPAPAVRLGRGRPDDPHPALPRRQRQLRLAELADDRRLLRRHRRTRRASPPRGTFGPTPAWFGALVIGLAALVVVLSWWPVRNMASPGQAMNASFNPFHLVNTYGAFGTVGRTRYEVVVEGAADGAGRTTAGASTSSRASPATRGGGRRRSRRTTTASTG